jgi:predicted permease
MRWNDALLRVRALIFRRRVEQELDEELQFHIEMQTRKNVAAGMSDSEASQRARVLFGGMTQVKEVCRDARRVRFIETTWQDVRYAGRCFRRSPIFVLTVVVTIALGLGLNTALFTIFNASYFKPLSVRDPYSLYELSWVDRAGDSHEFTWPQYQEFLEENPAFLEALGYRYTQARMDGRNVLGTLVTGGYFRMLGVGAAYGRTLLPEDSSAPGREPVIVLSYAAWHNHFAGDPDIVGKKVLLRGYPFEVVGVAREGFTGLGARPSEFWAPLTMMARLDGGPDLLVPERPQSLSIVGRLKTGFDVRQAQAGLTLWAQRFTAIDQEAGKAVQVKLTPRGTYKPFNRGSALMFSPILMAFGLVLLIGCVNVANMMLARAVSRQREIGIRLSLGADRGRLIRQLLTESLLLAVPAAAAGLAVSQATIGVCIRVLFATLPPGIADFATRLPQLSLDIRVFCFNLTAALGSALLFGMAPAMQATRPNIAEGAKGEFTGEPGPRRLRNSLVIGQVTVCVLLLITAAILLRGVNRIRSLDADLSTRDVIEIAIQEKSRARVLARLSSDPIIEILAAAANIPMGRMPTLPVMATEGGSIFHVAANKVSPEYFTLFEIPMIRGRNFTNEEASAGAPVAVISQSAAQQLWPNQEAVGRILRFVPERSAELTSRRPQVMTVIGIARDEISRWLTDGEDKTLVYFPSNPHAAGNELFIGVHGDAATAIRTLDAGLTTIDPNAVDEIRKIQAKAWVAEDAYTFRVAYWLSSAIGVLALLLTLSGIYGVLSYLVSQRTKEIGIRMALGATTRAVTGLVLKQSMRLAIIGTALGSLLTLGVSRLLASVLVMINTFDAVAYISVVLLVLGACAGAGYFPSRRAARIDPTTTLRYD